MAHDKLNRSGIDEKTIGETDTTLHTAKNLGLSNVTAEMNNQEPFIPGPQTNIPPPKVLTDIVHGVGHIFHHPKKDTENDG